MRKLKAFISYITKEDKKMIEILALHDKLWDDNQKELLSALASFVNLRGVLPVSEIHTDDEG